ncbi:MAG: histidine kinase [Desulfuromonas sp.]|nr:histidine kinase [Desulfuromonas sp.]
MAPAAVLLIMGLLLIFLQYTYWDLSVQRREANRLGKSFIALAEADLSAKRIHALSLALSKNLIVNVPRIDEVEQLYSHLSNAVNNTIELLDVPEETAKILRDGLAELDPTEGIDPERFLKALKYMRPHLISLIETARNQRGQFKSLQSRNMDELVARTALVSLIVLSTAIVLGILLSLFFARRILRRIQSISTSASSLLRGELRLASTPATISDELDDLSVSLANMADKLIRVVGAEKLLEGAEEERRRIARDLHDQTLSDLSNILRDMQDLPHQDCSIIVPRLQTELQGAINNLRDVMDDLHPQTLDVLGLNAALESHIEGHQNGSGNHIECNYYASEAAENLSLSKTVQLQLYRIVVEAIHNVYKHSGASRYEVNFDYANNQLKLSVEDNGHGFTLPKDSLGRGLHNIQERARAIGAQVEWKPSRFSSGTRFELTLGFTPDNSEKLSTNANGTNL